MINIDNKTYRNLEEQVGYNTDKVNELSSRLNRQFVDINGIVPDVASLPKDLPNGSYYLVGIQEPYDLYYHVYDRWVNLGVFTFKGDKGPMGAVGPQGEQGPQGERGIEGPMGRPGQTGPQGLRGPQGEQGPQGPKGDKGEEGTIFYVVSKLNSVSELPDASTVPTTNSYLVKSAHTDTQGNPIYDLYMITRQGMTQSWVNVGAMTGANTRIIEIKAPASAKNGTLTADQLAQVKDSVVNMIKLGDQTYTPGSHTQGFYVYRCLTDDKNLILSINETNGAWTLTTYTLPFTPTFGTNKGTFFEGNRGGQLEDILEGNYRKVEIPYNPDYSIKNTMATNDSGKDSPYDGIDCTDFIPVGSHRQIKLVKGERYWQASSLLFYTSEKQLITSYPRIEGTIGTVENLVVDVPSNAMYMRFNGGRVVTKVMLFDYQLVVPRDPLLDKITTKTFVPYRPDYSIKNTMIVNDNGKDSPYDGINSTDYIPINPTDTAQIKLVKGASWFQASSVHLYDANKIYLDYFPKKEGTPQYNVYITENLLIDLPSNVAFVRFSSPVGGIQTDIQFSETTVKGTGNKPWIGKKWVCIGDSLTERNSRTTKHYHDYVSDATGIEVINKGVSGSGYMRRKDDGNAFFQRIASIPTDVDVVTIFGSGNDLGAGTLGSVTDSGTDTVCGCMNTTLDLLIKRFLDAGKAPVIGVISPTPWTGANFSTYCKCLKEICEKKSIPFYDLYYKSNLHPNDATFRQLFYSRDDGNGVHPDENGHKIIAPHFKAFLETLIRL